MDHITGCVLAVKIDGVPYLVEGSHIDDHGDAHAEYGMCLMNRTAIVTGTLKDDKFIAESFELE